ncbi:exonuclease domain-containing protein [Gephyromycinifex aptenodytis]|uniref:exonuclease domain-containing protein n=1 Tax=Gephyromycinifex aptenodytis TaxID=2716227 RepID=UPI001B2FF8B5|nr:exonuclease domain-containing protein [Gephyromycinifex aptenodytis]
MSWWPIGANAQRRRVQRSVSEGPLRDYLDVPVPANDTPAEQLPLLAVDLETTGLSARTDRILSVGFVPVDGNVINLSGARHIVVRSQGEVGQSAAVHGLTDDAVAAGVPLAEALAQLLAALRGRVLLAHYATIEQEFLSAACRAVYGHPLPVRVVDTLELQRRLTTTAWDDPRAGSLRLGAARAAHGLPRYRAHEALTDALSCAELWLAQSIALSERGQGRLGQLAR